MEEKPKPDDIVIAVMGITGVGKSTFVSYFTREHVPVSNRLNSCTQKIGVYKCSLPRIPRFFLVDTPGFDDSDRSDADVLKELAKHLATAYTSKIRLTGLIYLHRIMDTRFGGASGRNLTTFKKLTGKQNLGSVVLGTTFWKKPLSSDDKEREKQLDTDPRFGWSKMLEEGAKSMRQDEGAISGAAIIQHLVDQRRQVSLQIQLELVDQGKSIEETEAGSEVISAMYKKHEEAMAKLREEFEEALNEHDKKWQKKVEEEQAMREYLFEREGRGLRERLSVLKFLTLWCCAFSYLGFLVTT